MTFNPVKRLTAGALTLALTCLGLVAGASQGGAQLVSDTLTFSATVDAAVAGGQWLLTTYGGADEELPITLAAGDVPADGILAIDVPLTAVTAATSRYFVLRALRALDHDHGRFASVSQGLLRDALVAGRIIDLGHAEAHDTLINEAQAALPTTPEGTFDPGTVPQQSSGVPVATIATAPTFGGPSVPLAVGDTSPPQTQSVTLPPAKIDCDLAARCGGGDDPLTRRGNARSDQSAKCSTQWYGTNDCMDAYWDYHGIRAFRGHAVRPIGANNTFKVLNSNAQKWDNGYRTSAGPFRLDGSTTRQMTASQEDGWPERGDCWNPPTPGDRNCATDATEAKWGRDTWRWERHRVYYCSYSPSGGQYCNSVTDERLRERSYDGGTETPSYGSPGNNFWYEQPSRVDAGAYGAHAPYFQDSDSKRSLENSVSYSNSAYLSINPPNGWGSAEFSSTMVNTTTRQTTNWIEFRNDLPWMGRWWRYDGGQAAGGTEPWQREFWSCEWTPGWTGGTDCWPWGS